MEEISRAYLKMYAMQYVVRLRTTVQRHDDPDLVDAYELLEKALVDTIEGHLGRNFDLVGSN